jgi:hypothetical protein
MTGSLVLPATAPTLRKRREDTPVVRSTTASLASFPGATDAGTKVLVTSRSTRPSLYLRRKGYRWSEISALAPLLSFECIVVI